MPDTANTGQWDQVRSSEHRNVDVALRVPAHVRRQRVYPFEVLLPEDVIGTGHESVVMPQQVRTISKLRLLERIGVLTDEELHAEIENRLLEHLGIEFEAEEL